MFSNSKTSVTKLQRLYNIHKEILSGKKPTAESLAEKLKCGLSTIYKDISELKEMVGTIETDGRYGGYSYVGRNNRFPYEDKMFENNLNLLSSAKLLLTHFENTPFYSEMENLLNTVCGKQTDSPLLSRIALAPTPNTVQPINPIIWTEICKALKNNNIIKFRYHHNSWDSDLENLSLHVEPYQLLIDEGKCLLFGFLIEKKAVRLYNINDMYELFVDESKSFKLPKDYEFKNHTGKSHFGAFTRYAERQYKIAFYEDAIPEIKLGNWAEDQVFTDDVDEEGYERTVVTFTSAQDMRVLDWVFKNKAYAKPLAPESLVTRWKYNVAVMAKMAGFDVEIDYSLLDKADELERLGK